MDRKGDGPLYPTVFFLILNLAFFSILFVFVSDSSSNEIIYEEAYAKEIALILDKSDNGMRFSLDFKDGLEVARKNNYIGEIVSIDEDRNLVYVKLSDSSGYGYKFFSDNGVNYGFNGDNLIINIKETKDG